MELRAVYFDGKSPIEHDVRVIWADRSWVIYESTLDWSLAQISMEWIDNQLHVSHKQGLESFVITDLTPEECEALSLGTYAKKPSSKWHKVGLLLLLTIGVFVGLYSSIRPISYFLANQVSPRDERAVFDRVTPIAMLENSRCTQWDAQNFLNRLGQSLGGGEELPPSFEIIEWDMPNAFAFPGRRIYVTQSLLDTLETPEQLIAVLAHERGHIELRHNVGETVATLMKAYLWSIAVGDFSGGFLVDPSLAKDLSDASYSRELESAADDYGSKLLHKKGYDPKALGTALEAIEAAVLKKVEETDSKGLKTLHDFMEMINRVFGTHPGTPERKKAIALKYEKSSSKQVITADEWEFLRRACKSNSIGKTKSNWFGD